MKKIKILIVEDELIIAEDIKQMLQRLGYEVVGIAMKYSQALKLIETENPDLLLLDIVLGGTKDGVDLALEIKEKHRIPFIFITSHADKSTVERAKKSNPNGYLVKPFEAEDIYTSIEIALVNFASRYHSSSTITQSENISGENDNIVGLFIKDSIFLKDGNCYIKQVIDDIFWVSSDKNYVEIHSLGQKKVIRSTLNDIATRLPSNKFFRVHKSHIVNLQKVSTINSSYVIVNESKLPVGRNYRDALLKHLNTL